eukprot:scaffold549_cov174-Ochromonas_danica.AAC.1
MADCNNEECKKLNLKIPRKDGNTTGLSKHRRTRHIEDFELILKERAAKEEKKVKEQMASSSILRSVMDTASDSR